MAAAGRWTGLKSDRELDQIGENTMSKMCGDTARFHRIRKQRLVKRARVRALRDEIAGRKSVPADAVEKPKP